MVETIKSTTKKKAAKTKEETHNEQDELLNRELEDSFPAAAFDLGLERGNHQNQPKPGFFSKLLEEIRQKHHSDASSSARTFAASS